MPSVLAPSVCTSFPTKMPFVPMLAVDTPEKYERGNLMNEAGIEAYISGLEIDKKKHFVAESQLWKSEDRVGIGIGKRTRTADDGKLFSVQHTVLRQPEHKGNEVGVLVKMRDGELPIPDEGFLRLGGDGRAATFTEVDYDCIRVPEFVDKFKVVMTTPGFFDMGWLPDAVAETESEYWLELPNFKARLACASIPRFEVISGWDIKAWRPKPADRVVASGSVYWFDRAEGDKEQLYKLAEHGWWPKKSKNDAKDARKAEGYNQVMLATW